MAKPAAQAEGHYPARALRRRDHLRSLRRTDIRSLRGPAGSRARWTATHRQATRFTIERSEAAGPPAAWAGRWPGPEQVSVRSSERAREPGQRPRSEERREGKRALKRSRRQAI